MNQLQFISVVRFTNVHAIGVAAINFAEEMSFYGKRVVVITAHSDGIKRQGIRVFSIGRHLPYSLQFMAISFFTLILSILFRNWHTFETPAIRSLTFHAHSDYWDKTKIVKDRSMRSIFRNLSRYLSKLGVNLACRRDTIICFPSASLSSRIRLKLSAAPKYEMILPNVLSSTDDLYLSKTQMPKHIGPEIKIGFVAQGDSIYKGLPIALDILSRSKQPASLYIAGLTDLIDSSENKVDCIYLGSLSRTEMRDFYQGISYLLICSVYESFSMTALEALYLGTPVLYTGQLGINEFVPENCFKKIDVASDLDFDELRNTFQERDNGYQNLRLKRAELVSELIERFDR